MKVTIIIEQADGNFSAYSPDLPGCIATGNTVEETEQNMVEAIRFHLEGMAEENISLPVVPAIVRQVEVAA